MATHVITGRADALNAGDWAAVAAAWPTNTWNGNSGSQAISAHGGDLGQVFLEIAGGPLDDGGIPPTARVDDITQSFDWQIFLTAGNEVLIVDEFGSGFTTVTGDASGSRSVGTGPTGVIWQSILDAHLQIFGWSFQSSNAVQAGGFAQIIITNFKLTVTYVGDLVAIRLPPVPGRVPARQGRLR